MSEQANKRHNNNGLRQDILFFLNGISSLLGWNAVLTSLDYFKYVYPQNVYQYFPIPLFVAYALVGVAFNYLSTKFSYKTLVSGGIIVTNVSLALLFILSVAFRGENADIGFWMSLIICFAIGVGSNAAQLSFFAMINFLSRNAVSKFTIGTAVSGLSITLIRVVIVAIGGADNSNVIPIIIYFVIAITFNFVAMVLNIRFFGSELYKNSIETHSPSNTIKQSSLLTNRTESDEQKVVNNEISYFRNLWQTNKIVFPFPMLLFMNYIITFILFPDITLRKTFDWDPIWSGLVLILVYNLGDTAGKIVGDYRWTFNSKSCIYAAFARFYFFVSITILATGLQNDDVVFNNNFFPFFNQFLFALTNGFVTNICFILCFENAPDKYKKYAGVWGGLCLQFGIMMGTLLNIPYEKIVF